MRVILSFLIAVVFFFMPAAPVIAGELPDWGSFFSVQERYKETIGEGLSLTSYSLTLNGRPVKASVLDIDLTNPYVKLDALVGADGTLEKTQSVGKMVERTGALAAINGGFFIMDQGKPLGMVVRNGELVSSPIMRGDMPTFALDMENRSIMDFFQFSGTVTAGNGASFPLFGVNKLLYVLEDGWVSDINRLTLYDRNWGPLSRGDVEGLPGAMEVVVENNIVTKQVHAGEPLPIPAGGYVLWGHGIAADFISENLPVGSQVTVGFQSTPAFERLKVAAGSNSFLVQQGKVARFQENIRGKNARTAVASADGGKTLYLVAVEKGDHSTGVEQTELAELLVAMGAEEAVNLDGGGSTTMVARHLGDTGLSAIVQPKGGWQRPVPDAIGVFNTAPLGQPAGLLISGPDTILAGTSAGYTAKGYDSHFHPWQPKELAMRVIGDGSAENCVFTAGSGGDVILEFSDSGVKEIKKVHVIGASEIRALRAEPASIRAQCGQTIPLTFTVETLDGRVFPLDARYVSISTTCGKVDGNLFKAGETVSSGTLEVSYQGLTVQVPVRVGSIFSDIENNWAEDYVNELAEAGIISGFEDGTFRPKEPVTRAQVVTLLARLLQWPTEKGTLNFKDEVPAWAKDAVAAAVARGVVKGYPDQKFRPDRPVTRAEISIILDNAVKLAPGTAMSEFKDVDQIPVWAREAMGRVISAGVMRGYEDGLLRPEANLTRAEMAVLIKRIIGLNYVKVD